MAFPGNAIERWEIGFAPDWRKGLFEHLTGKAVAADLVVAAGLAARPDDGGTPYDRFRGRIIFPIRDGRGRAIALGGRAMDPEARAKYLNSPETDLFDKGRTLFNLGPARTAAGKGQPLVVAEGYMDVIALSEAGFEAAVAPLGTAVTSDQLAHLWRISPEPVIALDGDQAGLSAALRLIDLALPSLAAGRSLRFCLMPPGKDPDDVIRAGGAAAMQEALDKTRELFSMLWQRETKDREFSSPEGRAALEQRMRSVIDRISDSTLRKNYRQELNDLLFRQRRRSPERRPGGAGRAGITGQALDSTKRSRIVAGAFVEVPESVILAAVIDYPDVLPEVLYDLEGAEFGSPLCTAILEAIVDCEKPASELKKHIADRIGAEALETFLSQHHIACSPLLAKRCELDYVGSVITDTLKVRRARRALEIEVAEVRESRNGLTSEVETTRLRKAAEARFHAESGPKDDRVEYDFAPSGAKMIRAERNALDRGDQRNLLFQTEPCAMRPPWWRNIR